MNDYAVIMAGGIGTRFWPKGTTRMPKQFLKIADDSVSMIQKTYARISSIIDDHKIYVVTNNMYRQEVKKQIPKLPDENIICEPFGRNTAPCIGLACVFISRFDPQANVIVLPSDHIISREDEFLRVVKCGLKFVSENGGIVTLGITPSKPETGYGYIQFDTESSIAVSLSDESVCDERIYKVKTFAEKPNLELANAFLASGDFLWNSGMFMFRTDTMMNEIKQNLPEIHSSLMVLESELMKNTFNKVLEDEYSKMKGISIDYGVMERSSIVYTIKSDFGWSDVGSWDEVYNLKEKDNDGNVKQGRVVTINSKNCLILNEQRITAAIGVQDLLIIDTDAGLLVCKKGESQNVKEIVDFLRRKGLEEYI